VELARNFRPSGKWVVVAVILVIDVVAIGTNLGATGEAIRKALGLTA